MEETITHDHPLLGKVKGQGTETTKRFLGIKYGNLEHKFAPSTITPANAAVGIDATNTGPAVPSLPIGLDLEYSFIQKSLDSPTVPQSDTDGLNLNIIAPKDAATTSNLPVLAFLHGGGFALGSNAWPQYDFQRLVELSTQLKQPIIGVNLNYRLGAFGFLTSQELRDHGICENNGLNDQKNALLWLKEYIGGFGGDPDNITLAGESAGGVAATYHLQSETPLFRRMISMGGTNFLMRPLPPFVTEDVYGTLVKILGMESLAPTERVKALIATDSAEIIKAIPMGMPLMPSSSDGKVLKDHSYKQVYDGIGESFELPGRVWCPEIMIGDCQMDASILAPALEPRKQEIARAFSSSLANSLQSPANASMITAAYDITEDISDDGALRNILNFANDIAFFVPTLNYAHCWSGHALVYNFDEPNTWPGPWTGFASHILDVAYLFQNYLEHLDGHQRTISVQFGTDLIKFVNGDSPWQKFQFETGDLAVQVYGGAAKGVTTMNASDTARRDTLIKLSSTISHDDLSRAWGMFMAGN